MTYAVGVSFMGVNAVIVQGHAGTRGGAGMQVSLNGGSVREGQARARRKGKEKIKVGNVK